MKLSTKMASLLLVANARGAYALATPALVQFGKALERRGLGVVARETGADVRFIPNDHGKATAKDITGRLLAELNGTNETRAAH